jgi:alpha 1,2-mannosyltransferase
MEPHFAALDVRLVDAFEVRRRRPCRRLAGWEIKPYSIINSSFREVLLLDADNVVTRDPEYLFLTEQYQDFGAVFWPDVHYFDRKNELWDVVAMNPTKVREVETGQVLVNKEVCWKALQVTMWMNEHSDYFYRHVHGDKETFNFGFRFARHLFATPPAEPAFLMKNEKELGAMLHFDFDGGRVFQHRIGAKWDFDNNVRLPECYYEKECLEFIEELKRKMEKSK